jgi:DNA-binding response OmpR family regulator
VRILLFNDRRSEREAMARALPKDSHSVEATGDESAALASIARAAPQVLVVSVPAKGGADLLRRLRGADATGQTYVVALLEPTPAGREINNLIAAGAHDFMRRPFIDAELLERVRAPLRLLRWARSVTKPAAFDFSGALDLRALKVWKNIGGIVAEDLAQMAGQSFAVCEGWPRLFTPSFRSATIPMSLAGDQLEVRVSIVVDSHSSSWVCAELLGDPAAAEEAVDDALREFANTAAGAIKRALLDENVVLTTGLPVSDAKPAAPGDQACWTLKLNGDLGAIAIAVVVEIKTLENQRVQASKLTEGMVIAHDIRNEAGILLVPAGSRLTSTSAIKLAMMLGPSFFLEVAPPAA